MRRDRERGNDHDTLWREVWGPNDDDYFRRYRPDRSARVVLRGFSGDEQWWPCPSDDLT